MSCPLSSSARFELPQRPVPQPERDQPLVRGRLRYPDSSRQPDQRRHGWVRDRGDDLRVCLAGEAGSVADAGRCGHNLAHAFSAQVEHLCYCGKGTVRRVPLKDLLVACFHRRISLETARSHAATRAVGS